MVSVFRACKRVLRADGTLFCNMGDCYQNKQLVGQPFRLALALQADGWYWRSCMSWYKRSAMPESTTDRPSTALEYVLLFAKAERYYWDQEAVRRPHAEVTINDRRFGVSGTGRARYDPNGDAACPSGFTGASANGRNLRNSDFYFDSLDLAIQEARAELAHLTHLWERGGLLLSEAGEPLALDVNTEACREAHFAAFPKRLVTPLIQAGTSERGVCADCGAPWHRVTEKSYEKAPGGSFGGNTHVATPGEKRNGHMGKQALNTVTQTLGWRKSCRCETDATLPAVVLDPFAGTGTVGLAAAKLGRRALLIDLKPDYIELSKKRNAQVSLLL